MSKKSPPGSGHWSGKHPASPDAVSDKKRRWHVASVLLGRFGQERGCPLFSVPQRVRIKTAISEPLNQTSQSTDPVLSAGLASHDKTSLGLRWLVRLRWLAVMGQALTSLAAAWILHIPLPVGILTACFSVTILSNGIVALVENRLTFRKDVVCAGLLALDAAVLTTMLYFTGGASNPFASFYLLHIVIAAILLPPLWTWGMLALCCAGYGILFLSPYPLADASEPVRWGTHDLRLQGMFVAMVLVGAFVAFFVSQLSRSLVRREEELLKARLKTQRSERFAALATLAAGVAHELATPLSTIAVVSADFEHLSSGMNCCDTTCRSDAVLIRSEVKRCQAILEKLGQRATNGVGEPLEPVLLEELPSLLRPYLKEPIWQRVDFKNPGGNGEILVPRATLLQSLAALIKNASEASPPASHVGLTAREEDTGICFSVSDTGTGMPSDVVARVGEPFFTTKEPGKGMGLGLFLVRTFAECINGRLDIESEPGKGTRINLFIPLQEKEEIAWTS